MFLFIKHHLRAAAPSESLIVLSRHDPLLSRMSAGSTSWNKPSAIKRWLLRGTCGDEPRWSGRWQPMGCWSRAKTKQEQCQHLDKQAPLKHQMPKRENVLQEVSTTSDDLVARLALPDTGDGTLDGVLAAEGAVVLGVLRDFDLLHDLTERRTVTGTVLTTDANFLSALALLSATSTSIMSVFLLRHEYITISFSLCVCVNEVVNWMMVLDARRAFRCSFVPIRQLVHPFAAVESVSRYARRRHKSEAYRRRERWRRTQASLGEDRRIRLALSWFTQTQSQDTPPHPVDLHTLAVASVSQHPSIHPHTETQTHGRSCDRVRSRVLTIFAS